MHQHLDASELTVMLLALALLIGVARLFGEIAQRCHQPAICAVDWRVRRR